MSFFFLKFLFLKFLVKIFAFECVNPRPLGGESGLLPDASFTATSYASSREPWKARLRGQFGKLSQ
jgi:hypothetical protein